MSSSDSILRSTVWVAKLLLFSCAEAPVAKRMSTESRNTVVDKFLCIIVLPIIAYGFYVNSFNKYLVVSAVRIAKQCGGNARPESHESHGSHESHESHARHAWPGE